MRLQIDEFTKFDFNVYPFDYNLKQEVNCKNVG